MALCAVCTFTLCRCNDNINPNFTIFIITEYRFAEGIFVLSSQLVEDILKKHKAEGGEYEAAMKELREKEKYLDKLSRTLHELSGAQEIIDAASACTGNPYFYLDKDYSIIAITRNLDFDYDEEWEYMSTKGYLSPLTARLMKEEGDLGFLADADEPVIFNNPMLFPFSSINCNVRFKGEFMGRLNMLGVLHEPDITDVEAFKIIMKHLIRLFEEADSTKSGTAVRKMFKNILSGTVYSREHIENTLIEADFPVSGFYSLYAVDTNSKGDPQIPVYYESALERVMVGEHVLIFTYGDMLILIAAARSEKDFAPIEFKLNAFLNAQSLRLGAGSCFKNMDDIFGIYTQALAALKLGKGTFIRYKDIMSENILSYIPDKDIRYIISDDIFRLLDADADCSFSMLETLRAYLANSCSLRKTADALFIHKNTLLYRLGKIKEVLSDSLDDSEEILRLTLSLKLWERANP